MNEKWLPVRSLIRCPVRVKPGGEAGSLGMMGYFWIAVRVAILAAIGFTLYLYFSQTRMVFHARRYQGRYQDLLPSHAAELHYTTECGRQTVYYIPPKSAAGDPALETEPPACLWILFGGTGSLALEWTPGALVSPDSDAGFLLVDYPGYGNCEGSPSFRAIRTSMEAAYRALAEHLHTTTEKLGQNVCVMGHSLGSATELMFALNHPVHRVVMVAPFTSISDMARRAVGYPLCLLLKYRFSNVDALKKLNARPEGKRPVVIVVHGDADQTVPVEMSRRLAKMFPDMIHYEEIPGAGHVSVLDGIERTLHRGYPGSHSAGGGAE